MVVLWGYFRSYLGGYCLGFYIIEIFLKLLFGILENQGDSEVKYWNLWGMFFQGNCEILRKRGIWRCGGVGG